MLTLTKTVCKKCGTGINVNRVLHLQNRAGLLCIECQSDVEPKNEPAAQPITETHDNRDKAGDQQGSEDPGPVEGNMERDKGEEIREKMRRALMEKYKA